MCKWKDILRIGFTEKGYEELDGLIWLRIVSHSRILRT
jgi:hypothetical protein